MSASDSAESAAAVENQYPWRVGRSIGRMIYMQVGPEPSDADVLIGVMDSRQIAHEVVTSHNARVSDNGEPIRGFVADAGGGEIVVRVDRATLDYPRVNSVVLLYQFDGGASDA